jgi:AraC-like DNA-binding protein
VFRQAGLERAARRDPNARHSVAASPRLWRLAAEETRDPCFGLEVARHVSPTMFHALGFAVLASGTLREALERVARFFQLASDTGRMSLRERGGHLSLELQLNGCNPPADESIDAFMALIVRVARVLVGRDFSPIRVELRRERPPQDAAFARCFRCPVEFGSPENVIVVDPRAADAPLPSADPELARVNDQMAAQAVARMTSARASDRVRGVLVERLPSGEPSQEDVARTLKMSARSLQRRLAAEAATYAQILDDTRRGLATTYVVQNRYSLGEIGYLLGFSGASCFVRAFRRWTGVTPTAYRAARVTEVAEPGQLTRRQAQARG